jgi:hypothetical protein
VPVEVTEEHGDELGMLPFDCIDDADRAHDATLAALPGSAKAEKADHVGAVGVEVLLSTGLVESRARVGWIGACVSNVREKVALKVLGHWSPKVESQRPVSSDRAVDRVKAFTG